jgi:plastocyanin
MHFSKNLIALAMLALVGSSVAQQTPPKADPKNPPKADPPKADPAKGGKNHEIIVGNNTLTFLPGITKAAIGDTVTFTWPAGNKAPHSVVQGVGKDALCTKKEPTAKVDGDPKTGPLVFQPSGPQNASYTFKIDIKDTAPIWFYCGVVPHCNKGMYGVINPPAGLDTLPPPPTAPPATTPPKADPAKPADGDKSTPAGTNSTTSPAPASNSATSLAVRSSALLGVVAAAAVFLR